MASYDSDSSGAGDDYTETSVLLGYATKEATGDIVSHLGGQPEWLDADTAPSGAYTKCKVCNSYLTLLLQLNGDLPEQFPGHERRLYIWSCRRKTCRRKEGSIRGLRSVRISESAAKKSQKPKVISEPEAEPKKPQTNLGESLFGAKPSTTASGNINPFSANPFSSQSTNQPLNPFSSSAQSANPFASASSLAAKPAQTPTPEPSQPAITETFASKLRISSPPPSTTAPRSHEPWPSPSSFPSPYPQYSLDADYETLDAPKPAPIPANARMDIDGEASSTSGGKEDKEAFESTLDTAFQKFADRLAQNPEQVIRYKFKGAPLLYSKTDAVGKVLGAAEGVGGKGMPRCGGCGAERVFEVQMTPHAITALEAEEEGLEGMEWGTIILGVCSRDCGESAGGVGYMEEWVGVQWEEVKR